MWAPFFLLAFLNLSCATNRNVDPMTQKIQLILKEDFFYTHLKSEFVNTSINPCDNFYRRLCPRNVTQDSWIWFKIQELFQYVMEMEESVANRTEEDLMKQAALISQTDRTNYTAKDSIYSALNRVNSADTLAVISRDVVVFGNNMEGFKYSHILREALNHNRSNILNVYAEKIHTFMKKQNQEHPFGFENNLKYFANFEDLLRVEKTLRIIVQRKGLNHKESHERIETIISNIIEEFLGAIKEARWSIKEDRFGNTRENILTTHIENLKYAVVFANRYSIPDQAKDNIMDKYYDLFHKQYQLLSDLSHMPLLRVFLAKSYTYWKILEELPQYQATKIFLAKDSPRDAQAFSIFGEGVSMIIVNHIFTLQASFSAQTASLLAFTGFTFGHEMYHQIQSTQKDNNAIIEDLSNHERAKECVNRHMDRVCSRFTEKACSSGTTENEDGADIFGVQIAFKVLQKMLGPKLDQIVFPDLNMTHRELFYNTLAASGCNPDQQAQWRYSIADIHSGWLYRVNGMLGQLPDFKRTFDCYDNDPMVFPENSMCPAFSDEMTRRK